MRSYKPKKPEPAQPSLFDQPDNRPRCTCGKPLYHGVCLVCTPKQIQAARMSAALQTVARAMAG